MLIVADTCLRAWRKDKRPRSINGVIQLLTYPCACRHYFTPRTHPSCGWNDPGHKSGGESAPDPTTEPQNISCDSLVDLQLDLNEMQDSDNNLDATRHTTAASTTNGGNLPAASGGGDATGTPTDDHGGTPALGERGASAGIAAATIPVETNATTNGITFPWMLGSPTYAPTRVGTTTTATSVGRAGGHTAATAVGLPYPTSVNGIGDGSFAGARKPTPVTPCTTRGIAAGDGDLMPPRFNGDRRIDADDWAQDFVDYVTIRRVPQDDAAILLRTRLTGAARTWLESVPTGTTFDDIIDRFRKRFGASDGHKPELMTEFWERRQTADESATSYIEEKARLARRMRIESQPFILQGIIQGLHPDVRRDVVLQRPATLEALNEAAAIADASAKSIARAKTADVAVSNQLAEMRAMMAVMQEMMVSGQRPTTAARATDTTVPRPGQPAHTATVTSGNNAATRDLPRPTLATAPTTTEPRGMTIQLVMPDAAGNHYAGGGRGDDGPSRRGRGRGWRGQYRRTPVAQPTPPQQLSATAAPFQPNTGDTINPPCQNCGLTHNHGDCRATFVRCFECNNQGHYARCCSRRINPYPQH